MGSFEEKMRYFKMTSKEMKYFKRTNKEMIYLLKKDGLLLKEADNDILLKDDQGDKRKEQNLASYSCEANPLNIIMYSNIQCTLRIVRIFI